MYLFFVQVFQREKREKSAIMMAKLVKSPWQSFNPRFVDLPRFQQKGKPPRRVDEYLADLFKSVLCVPLFLLLPTILFILKKHWSSKCSTGVAQDLKYGVPCQYLTHYSVVTDLAIQANLYTTSKCPCFTWNNTKKKWNLKEIINCL